MHDSGDYSISDLVELFARRTVYRTRGSGSRVRHSAERQAKLFWAS